MKELFLTWLFGVGFLTAAAAVLFLFGCVMCALTDTPGYGERAPVWVRWLGWITIAIPLTFLLGWTVRGYQ